jgi:hypothetical protein
MEPADIYMTVELAMISGTPVDRVVEIYRVNQGKGWGVIAKQLGIKPGSAAFKALKNKAVDHATKLKNKGKGKNQKK